MRNKPVREMLRVTELPVLRHVDRVNVRCYHTPPLLLKLERCAETAVYSGFQ